MGEDQSGLVKGALVLHHLANAGHLDRGSPVRTKTLPDRFIDHTIPEMYGCAGLTAADIAATVKQADKPPVRPKIINLARQLHG